MDGWTWLITLYLPNLFGQGIKYLAQLTCMVCEELKPIVESQCSQTEGLPKNCLAAIFFNAQEQFDLTLFL